MIDPQYGIAFGDPAHPGSDESQADKHRRQKVMRGPLRAAAGEDIHPRRLGENGGQGPRRCAALEHGPRRDQTVVRLRIDRGSGRSPNSKPIGRGSQ